MKINTDIQVNNSNSSIGYKYSLQIMEKRVIDISLKKKKELIWFLNHDHIYTIGTSGQPQEFYPRFDIPCIETNRGGKITYHGPGQRIVYFLIDLKNRKKDIRKFVNIIEQSAINLLNEFDIEAITFSDRIGIWVIKNKKITLEKEKKIGAIGLRVKKWITYHGLSFNLNPDLNYYKNIEPCGLSNQSVTSLKSLGINLSQDTFDKLYLRFFLKELKNL